MAEQLFYPFRAVVPVQKSDFFAGPRVNAVQNGLAQRPAVFIHRKAVAAKHIGAYARNVSRVNAGFLQNALRHLAEIIPPDSFCILLKVVGLRVFHLMLCRMGRHHFIGFIHQHTLCLKGAHIYSKVIFCHGLSPPPNLSKTPGAQGLTSRCGTPLRCS